MNVYKRRGVFLVIMSVLCAVSGVLAQTAEGLDSGTMVLDWRTQALSIELSTSSRMDQKNRLAQTSRQGMEIGRVFSALLPGLLKDIQIDSRIRLADVFRADPGLELDFADWAAGEIPVAQKPGKTMQSTIARWSFTLFPLMLERLSGWFPTPKSEPLPQTPLLSPARPISSIVVYAPDPLPWHGMDETTLLVPALFPELMGPDATAFVGPSHIDPEVFRHRGMVRYVTEDQLDGLGTVLGPYPLVVRPRAVYGIAPTDPVLSAEDLQIVLASPEGRSAIRQGKIVVVCNDSVLGATSAIRN